MIAYATGWDRPFFPVTYLNLPQPSEATWTWVENPQKERKVHYHAARPAKRWKK